MLPKVSIIIINFNGLKFLKCFFESIRKLNYKNTEVIFIDNASIDGSVDYVKQNWPDVKIIRNEKNLGFAVANNTASKIADGEFFLFLNNDTKIHPDAVSEMIEKMLINPTWGICGCRMMDYNGKLHFHTGIGVDIFGYPVAKEATFYIEGSALLIRKELFTKLEGFDSSYFMLHEDVDLAWRAWLLGYEVSVAPEAIVYHFIGASAGGSTPSQEEKYKSTYFRRYLSERNNIRTLLKNYGFPTLLFILFVYFLINLMEMAFFLLLLKPKVAFCYLKAYLWNIEHLKDILVSRKKIQSTRKISDAEIFKKMYKGIGKLIAFKKVKVPVFG